MTELVTAAEARSHLRLHAGSADDAWLAIFIPAISEAVLNWLKDEWRAYVPELGPDGLPIEDSSGDPIPEVDSNGVMTPKWVVKAAVLVELAYQFRFREGEGEGTPTGDLYSGRYGYTLNKTSTALLMSLRKSTVA
jgi:hypothetical protein